MEISLFDYVCGEGVVHQGLNARRERRSGHIGGEDARGEIGAVHIPSLGRRESASARVVVNLLPLFPGVKFVQLLPRESKFERSCLNFAPGCLHCKTDEPRANVSYRARDTRRVDWGLRWETTPPGG